MRFEAKHAYFKRLARNAFNFRNIAKTLAKRHQRLMCYHFNSVGEGHSFLDDRVSTGKGKGCKSHSCVIGRITIYNYTIHV